MTVRGRLCNAPHLTSRSRAQTPSLCSAPAPQSAEAKALARELRRPPLPPSLPRTSGAASVRPPNRGPAMPRRRPRAGENRMDAAIDHFAEMGYRKPDVRRVVNKLLKDVYGKDGWPLLEDSCYSVVQEALFEMEEQEKVQQQQQQNEDDDGDDEGEEAHPEPQQEEVEEEAPQQEVAIEEETSEEFIPLAMIVPSSDAMLAVEQTEVAEPLPIDPPSPRAASPDPLATGTSRKRPSCYGWISESESDSEYEEYLPRRQQRVQVPAK